MNRLTATMMSLAVGLTSVKCTSDALPGSSTINAYASDVRSDIGHIGNDASTGVDGGKSTADTGVDATQQDAGKAPNFDNPCTKQLGQKWQTLLSGEYHYNPPPNAGADRATLEGVSKQDVLALAQLINSKAVTQLCYAQETVDPVDPEGDAVRVCDSIDLLYNGETKPDNEDVYIRCYIDNKPLPQGPKLFTGEKFLQDKIGISAATGFDYQDDPALPDIPTNAPAIYKDRMMESEQLTGAPISASFFLTGGNQDPKYGTGDFKRRSRIWISGK